MGVLSRRKQKMATGHSVRDPNLVDRASRMVKRCVRAHARQRDRSSADSSVSRR